MRLTQWPAYTPATKSTQSNRFGMALTNFQYISVNHKDQSDFSYVYPRVCVDGSFLLELRPIDSLYSPESLLSLLPSGPTHSRLRHIYISKQGAKGGGLYLVLENDKAIACVPNKNPLSRKKQKIWLNQLSSDLFRLIRLEQTERVLMELDPKERLRVKHIKSRVYNNPVGRSYTFYNLKGDLGLLKKANRPVPVKAKIDIQETKFLPFRPASANTGISDKRQPQVVQPGSDLKVTTQPKLRK
jgi:hypothetical protein